MGDDGKQNARGIMYNDGDTKVRCGVNNDGDEDKWCITLRMRKNMEINFSPFSPFAAVSLFGVAGPAETFPFFSVGGPFLLDFPGGMGHRPRKMERSLQDPLPRTGRRRRKVRKVRNVSPYFSSSAM